MQGEIHGKEIKEREEKRREEQPSPDKRRGN
jgi:hypothetical protein